jgi:hypothetical protein
VPHLPLLLGEANHEASLKLAWKVKARCERFQEERKMRIALSPTIATNSRPTRPLKYQIIELCPDPPCGYARMPRAKYRDIVAQE